MAQKINLASSGSVLVNPQVAVSGVGQRIASISGGPEDNFLIGTNVDDTLNGLAGNDTLIGLAGADTLDGGTGADLLVGGEGDDIFVVDNAGDQIWENQNEGQDKVQATISYTLPGNVENIELTGADNLNATGNNLNNTLSGNTGSNVLDGRGGSDKLLGGAGNDTYLIDSQDTITELANQGTDTVILAIDSYSYYALIGNLENLNLGANGKFGVGNNLNNSLIGNDQDNMLDGGAGKDTLIGGQGNDTYFVDNPGDVVTEQADGGLDQIKSSISFTLPANVEDLQLTGSGVINATGNDLNNVLTGNNSLNILAGGKGNDTYFLADFYNMDAVQENLGDGIDTVSLLDATPYGSNYTLPNNVENLLLYPSAYNDKVKCTGNALNNQLLGNQYGNTLDGKGGADFMAGYLGNDIYIVDDALDTVIEKFNEGSDTIQSSVSYSLLSAPNVENLKLTGSGNINVIGNSLANTLTGNSGKNILTGNGGSDNFVFGTALHNVDTISDFTVGVDRVSLAKSVFTLLGAVGPFVSNDARFYSAPGAIVAHDASDRVFYNTTNGNLYYDADGSGAGVATQFATLEGHPNLAATDLWVV